MEEEIQRLTQLAANAPSPHIRRIAGFIRLGLEGLNKAGIAWEAHKRYVSIDDGSYRGRYRHPTRVPRQRGRLVVHKMEGNRLGPIVRSISTLPEAIAFYNDPRIV